jgi:hypothetical protein
MKKILLLSLLALSGCAAPTTINRNLLQEPVPKDKARIIITRDSSFYYGGLDADISLNGTRLVKLTKGSTFVDNIPAGKSVLSVTAFGDPGHYTSVFDAKKGSTYKFQISPNEGKSALSTALFGYAGELIAAGQSQNTGGLQIKPISD